METVRDRLLAAAERLLVDSPDGEISTRAVCDAVGVTQPVLYRLFGDKRGLLDALAETGFARYAGHKAELEVTEDPIADMLVGWDDHMAFADGNPRMYRLMFAPRDGVDGAARSGILTLVETTLRRTAAAGLLARGVEESARLVLSANVGLALNRIAAPDVYADPALSHAMRDAVFRAVLVEGALDGALDTRVSPRGDAPLADAARRLDAEVALAEPAALAPEERSLLRVWLARLTG